MPHIRKGVILGCDTVLRAFGPISKREELDSPFSPEGDTVKLWELDRDGDLPLRFHGHLLSYAEHSTSKTSGMIRGTTVRIFVSGAGKIITSVQQWDGEEGSPPHRQAAAWHTDTKSALEWLIEDGKGKLGKTSKEAWLKACDLLPELSACSFEYVE
jgi:hypothetical protein